MQMHAGQLGIEAATVRRLVWTQFPQWVALPVRAVASRGTVNAIFRIGDGLVARFPLQPAEVAATRWWLEREAAATRELVYRVGTSMVSSRGREAGLSGRATATIQAGSAAVDAPGDRSAEDQRFSSSSMRRRAACPRSW